MDEEEQTEGGNRGWSIIVAEHGRPSSSAGDGASSQPSPPLLSPLALFTALSPLFSLFARLIFTLVSPKYNNILSQTSSSVRCLTYALIDARDLSEGE